MNTNYCEDELRGVMERVLELGLDNEVDINSIKDEDMLVFIGVTMNQLGLYGDGYPSYRYDKEELITFMDIVMENTDPDKSAPIKIYRLRFNMNNDKSKMLAEETLEMINYKYPSSTENNPSKLHSYVGNNSKLKYRTMKLIYNNIGTQA